MFVHSTLQLTSVGVVIDMGTAAALMELMKSVLLGVSPLDPITVPLVLAVSAILASYLPAPPCGSS